jgi:hypothetical protein
MGVGYGEGLRQLGENPGGLRVHAGEARRPQQRATRGPHEAAAASGAGPGRARRAGATRAVTALVARSRATSGTARITIRRPILASTENAASTITHGAAMSVGQPERPTHRIQWRSRLQRLTRAGCVDRTGRLSTQAKYGIRVDVPTNDGQG